MGSDKGKRKFKRLLLAADLHGSEITFRKFLAAATFYDADVLLIGGDLTAKSITPIVRQGDGRYIDEKVVRIDDDHEILGFGWTNPSPWNTPRELSEDRLKKRLDPLLNRVEDPAHAIYLMHAPPFETGLDIAPKLDATTDPP